MIGLKRAGVAHGLRAQVRVVHLEEVLGREDRLNLLVGEVLARDHHDAERDVRSVDVERGGQGVHVHGGAELRRREQDKVLRVSERRQVGRVVQARREAQVLTPRAHDAKRLASIVLVGFQRAKVRDVDLVEAAQLLVKAEQVSHLNELVPVGLVRGCRHDAGHELVKSVRRREGALHHRHVDRNVVAILTRDRVVAGLNTHVVRAEQGPLHDLTIGIVLMRLRPVRADFLHDGTVGQLTLLELRKRVGPQGVLNDGLTDLVDERVKRLIEQRNVVAQLTGHLIHVRLIGEGNLVLIVRRGGFSDQVQVVVVRCGLQHRNVIDSH